MDPLATVEDLEARLGRELTPEEAARADALLADASALLRAYTGQDFTLTVGDEIVLRPVGVTIRLPQRPVQAVTTVVALGGSEVMPDIALPAGSWTWDGIDKVDIWPLDSSWYLSLPEVWTDGWGAVDTYRITYDHGYAVAPPDVLAVVCAMVLRTLLSPSMTPGMVSERIGAYNYQLQQGAGSAGASVSMTQPDRDALKRYRKTATTIQLRGR
ncbi:hypothetical protein [Streptomyces sp. SBT349]|uniref:hypothetical protein n=1 Tax=Streptomyces sp. SBT349 TaxID=1580539 RepID=UPI00066E68A4|nr:hypothetical protein [Streptomyces sp. SBT349]